MSLKNISNCLKFIISLRAYIVLKGLFTHVTDIQYILDCCLFYQNNVINIDCDAR